MDFYKSVPWHVIALLSQITAVQFIPDGTTMIISICWFFDWAPRSKTVNRCSFDLPGGNIYGLYYHTPSNLRLSWRVAPKLISIWLYIDYDVTTASTVPIQFAQAPRTAINIITIIIYRVATASQHWTDGLEHHTVGTLLCEGARSVSVLLTSSLNLF